MGNKESDEQIHYSDKGMDYPKKSDEETLKENGINLYCYHLSECEEGKPIDLFRNDNGECCKMDEVAKAFRKKDKEMESCQLGFMEARNKVTEMQSRIAELEKEIDNQWEIIENGKDSFERHEKAYNRWRTKTYEKNKYIKKLEAENKELSEQKQALMDKKQNNLCVCDNLREWRDECKKLESKLKRAIKTTDDAYYLGRGEGTKDELEELKRRAGK